MSDGRKNRRVALNGLEVQDLNVVLPDFLGCSPIRLFPM